MPRVLQPETAGPQRIGAVQRTQIANTAFSNVRAPIFDEGARSLRTLARGIEGATAAFTTHAIKEQQDHDKRLLKEAQTAESIVSAKYLNEAKQLQGFARTTYIQGSPEDGRRSAATQYAEELAKEMEALKGLSERGQEAVDFHLQNRFKVMEANLEGYRLEGQRQGDDAADARRFSDINKDYLTQLDNPLVSGGKASGAILGTYMKSVADLSRSIGERKNLSPDQVEELIKKNQAALITTAITDQQSRGDYRQAVALLDHHNKKGGVLHGTPEGVKLQASLLSRQTEQNARSTVGNWYGNLKSGKMTHEKIQANIDRTSNAAQRDAYDREYTRLINREAAARKVQLRELQQQAALAPGGIVSPELEQELYAVDPGGTAEFLDELQGRQVHKNSNRYSFNMHMDMEPGQLMELMENNSARIAASMSDYQFRKVDALNEEYKEDLIKKNRGDNVNRNTLFKDMNLSKKEIEHMRYDQDLVKALNDANMNAFKATGQYAPEADLRRVIAEHIVKIKDTYPDAAWYEGNTKATIFGLSHAERDGESVYDKPLVLENDEIPIIATIFKAPEMAVKQIVDRLDEENNGRVTLNQIKQAGIAWVAETAKETGATPDSDMFTRVRTTYQAVEERNVVDNMIINSGQQIEFIHWAINNRYMKRPTTERQAALTDRKTVSAYINWFQGNPTEYRNAFRQWTFERSQRDR